MSDIVDDFVSFFRGRGDVYGHSKGFMVKEPLTRTVFERHLTSPNVEDHIGVYCMLNEQCSWGCIDIDGKDFPIPYNGGDADWKWDWPSMLTLAHNLHMVLANAPAGQIISHIEQTKNGYHVWVFPEIPLVSAKIMRRALMAACTAIGYDPKEVNPKAEGPRPGTKGYGNFVRLSHGGSLATHTTPPPPPSGARQELDARELGMAGWPTGGRGLLRHLRAEGSDAKVLYLPADDGQGCSGTGQGSGWCGRCGYSWGPQPCRMEGHLALPSSSADGSGSTGERLTPVDGSAPKPGDPRWPQRVFLDDESWLPLCVNCFLASAKRTSVDTLDAVSQLWTPPQEFGDHKVDLDAGLDVAHLLPLLDGLAFTIWQQGPFPGNDRSSTIVHLAHLLAERGLTATQAFAVLHSADERWGKYHDRPDELVRIVERVYA